MVNVYRMKILDWLILYDKAERKLGSIKGLRPVILSVGGCSILALVAFFSTLISPVGEGEEITLSTFQNVIFFSLIVLFLSNILVMLMKKIKIYSLCLVVSIFLSRLLFFFVMQIILFTVLVLIRLYLGGGSLLNELSEFVLGLESITIFAIIQLITNLLEKILRTRSDLLD